MSDLSVIIPCFNEEKTIQEVVKRINYLGINNLEIIIVDDGSTDGSYCGNSLDFH